MEYKVPTKQRLEFISNEDLYRIIAAVISVADKALEGADEKLHSNVIDPFSAIFDAVSGGLTLNDWIKKERTRQIQKTLQNSLGTFHQEILGHCYGWQDLETGGVVDIVNHDKKLLAEVKNKYNTTKGNHKTQVYDDLESLIASEKYSGYTGYYVEVIPKGRKEYNKLFTPSDNVSKTNRPENESIRQIDGKTFYALATGIDDAIRQLYYVLPEVIYDIKGENTGIHNEDLFHGLFNKAYRIE